MSALEIYADGVRITKGTAHMWALQNLRKYIKLCPDEELIRHINMMTDFEHLRILIEAGMRAPVHQSVISRINLLTKEQAEVKR
jgi:hypothetical protein